MPSSRSARPEAPATSTPFPPAPFPPRVAFLAAQPFAHRGLHGGMNGGMVIENSRAAFRAAVARGHGIELDVQAATAGEAFVFHDAELDRLTDAHGRLDARTAYELGNLTLRGSDETIPRLDEILRLVAGQVPVLIEVKPPRRRRSALCLSVRRALEGYRGYVAVMSFDPDVPLWFREHSERTVRGLVVTAPPPQRLRDRARRMLAMRAARPDFVAHDVRQLPTPMTARLRASGVPVLTWTVRSEADRATAAAYADQQIYEEVA